MPNTPVRAAAEGLPKEADATPYRRGRLFHFEPNDLPLKELSAFVDALTTVSAVLSGLQEQPRFGTDSGYTDTGNYLEGVRVALSFEIDAIRTAVRGRNVSYEDEAEHKFDILIGEKLYGGERPASTVADLATLVADLDWQVSRAQGQKGGAI